MEDINEVALRPKRVATEFYCELCDKYTTSMGTLETHYKGHKHQSTLRRQKEELRLKNKLQSEEGKWDYFGIAEDENGGFFCELCYCNCTCISNVQTHISGRQHQQNLTCSEKNRNTTRLERRLSKVSPVVGLDFVYEYLDVRSPYYPRLYKCILCFSKYREKYIIDHIISTQHRMRALKEYNEKEYYSLQRKRLSSHSLSIQAEYWASKLEKKYGRGTPRLKPFRHKFNLESPDIKGESSTGTYPVKSWIKDVKAPQSKKIKTEKPSTTSGLEMVKGFKVRSEKDRQVASALASKMFEKLASYKLTNTPGGIKKALGRNLFKELRAKAIIIPNPAPPKNNPLLSSTSKSSIIPPQPALTCQSNSGQVPTATSSTSTHQPVPTDPQTSPPLPISPPPPATPPPPIPPPPSSSPPPSPKERPRKIQTHVTAVNKRQKNQAKNSPVQQNMPMYPQAYSWNQYMHPPGYWHNPYPWTMMNGGFPPRPL